MSTFPGRVKEFPDIRIDYFHVSPAERPRPLAFFLSHVHSDHLGGLETCRSPFIYCSPATREILLRLEKYPHRMNFAKGILEARKQTYKHLTTLLKPVPLETPTVLELAPGRSIRVTLFDANHCTGANIFLIEDDTHAIIYTGDIRSEKWWVDALTRHPLLIPYVSRVGREPMKKLDCIYLDTTFAMHRDPYRHFTTKQDGLAELLHAVSAYPSDTTFYFNPWTFGYEEVWLALSGFLKTRIHVDDYRYGLYYALQRAQSARPNETYHLLGHQCGNHFVQGCLTRETARLHSCEYGTGCEVFDKEYVSIVPIITRHQGSDVAELGAGGGQGDLDQKHILELDDSYLVQGLLDMCRDKLRGSPAILEEVENALSSLRNNGEHTMPLDAKALHDADLEHLADLDGLPIATLVPAIVRFVEGKRTSAEPKTNEHRSTKPELLRADGLPKRITFPYSRHSSYEELRWLIEAFLPAEIYPCTVEVNSWTWEHSMGFLFADLYPAAKIFQHDSVMRLRMEQMAWKREVMPETQDPAMQTNAIPLDDGAVILAEPKSSAAIDSDAIDDDARVAADMSNKRKCADTDSVQQQEFTFGHSEAKSRQSANPAKTLRQAILFGTCDAARDDYGHGWDSVELISTGGYKKEEELG